MRKSGELSGDIFHGKLHVWTLMHIKNLLTAQCAE
jgi:hypothetical protein